LGAFREFFYLGDYMNKIHNKTFRDIFSEKEHAIGLIQFDRFLSLTLHAVLSTIKNIWTMVIINSFYIINSGLRFGGVLASDRRSRRFTDSDMEVRVCEQQPYT
jgi:hypothetical protein